MMPPEPSAPRISPVICAGVVVADHLCRPISRMPQAGELVMTDELVLAMGGCATNAAVDLAKLGVEASICGRVGADVFGQFVAEVLRSHGVDASGLRVDPDRATAQTLIVNVRGQDRRFIHSFGANAGLAASDLRSALRPETKILYVGGFLILPGMDPAELASLFREARRQGTHTVLDVAVPGPGPHREALAHVLPETDVFLPNGDEAKVILGEADPIRQAVLFHDMGAKRVIITQGEKGAISKSDQFRVRVGAYPVEYVDGTGGGDAFDAGYMLGMLEGQDEHGCLRYASAVGASCVRAIGTTAGVFTRTELDAFLREHTVAFDDV